MESRARSSTFTGVLLLSAALGAGAARRLLGNALATPSPAWSTGSRPPWGRRPGGGPRARSDGRAIARACVIGRSDGQCGRSPRPESNWQPMEDSQGNSRGLAGQVPDEVTARTEADALGAHAQPGLGPEQRAPA